ncbi:membrane-bound alpha-1,6- mannosyltransferase Initiation-specific, partial [Ceratobasidium sp. 392]
MAGLPVPSVAGTQHGKAANVYQVAKSKRVILLLFTLVLVTGFYILDAGPLLRERWSSYRAPQKDKIPTWNELGSITPIESGAEELSPEPLTPLGLEADRSFHLGSTSKLVYKAELERFVTRAFPKWLQSRARASIDMYFGNATTVLTLPEIPHNIYQTAKQEPHWNWMTSTWRGIEGYAHFFFDDNKADSWVSQVFNGTEIELVWKILGPGIKRSDLLRYLLVMVEGGIYSDIDTRRLKDISRWGQGADTIGEETVGLPSVVVGIEADAGTRSDWHKWWPRPLQIVQWTFAAAPLHPILIDTVRRIHHVTAVVEAHKNGTKSAGDANETVAHWVGGELLRDDGTVSIMEWTGPGVFTDSVLRYLASEHQVTWPKLKNLGKPVRARDAVVLPVTGFSPGVGMFGAGEPNDPEAMVHHLFEGSWKSSAKNERVCFSYVIYVISLGPTSPSYYVLYILHISASDRLYYGDASKRGELRDIPELVDEVSLTEPLSPLGLEADKTFHLGSTSKERYKAELEQFATRTFPKWLRKRAHKSIELYLGDSVDITRLPSVPHKIYQTAKREPYWTDQRLRSWQGIPGYEYHFFDDPKADKWVRRTFGGTEVELVWNKLGTGVKRADLLRYLLVMVEGGIYSDMDTVRLKPISKWGDGANFNGPEVTNPPSVFVGIEADVGNRPDWHKWWPRPLQIVQWTFAAAPLHPILIDTIRR